VENLRPSRQEDINLTDTKINIKENRCVFRSRMLGDHEDVFQGAARNVNDSGCYYGHVLAARIRVIKRHDVVAQ